MPLSISADSPSIDSYRPLALIEKKSPPTTSLLEKHKFTLLGAGVVLTTAAFAPAFSVDFVSCMLMPPLLLGLYSQAEAAQARYGSLIYVPLGLATLKTVRCCLFKSEESASTVSIIFKLALSGFLLATTTIN